jgi:hypothetical protein
MSCLFLVAVAVYATPAEELSAKVFFGREFSSPLWYRAGRLVLMCVPGSFLVVARRTKYRTADGADDADKKNK